MAYSPNNPFAPKEKEKQGGGTQSVTINKAGVPSTQPTTQKVYSSSNPFAQKETTQSAPITPTKTVTTEKPRIPSLGKLDALNPILPNFRPATPSAPPEKKKTFLQRVGNAAKEVALTIPRIGASALSQVAGSANFAAEFVVRQLPDLAKGSNIILDTVTKTKEGKKIWDAISNNYKQGYDSLKAQNKPYFLPSLTQRLSDYSKKVEQTPGIAAPADWSNASLEQKLTSRLPETLVQLAPSIVGSFGAFAMTGGTSSFLSTAESIKEAGEKYGISKDQATYTGLAGGAIVGLLDKFSFNRILSQSGVSKEIAGKTGQMFATGFLGRILKSGFTEGTTEALQEVAQIAAEKTFRNDLGWDEATSRIALNALGGLFGGSGLEVVGEISVNAKRRSLGLPPQKFTVDEQTKSQTAITSIKEQAAMQAEHAGRPDVATELRSIDTRGITNVLEAQSIVQEQLAGKVDQNFYEEVVAPYFESYQQLQLDATGDRAMLQITDAEFATLQEEAKGDEFLTTMFQEAQKEPGYTHPIRLENGDIAGLVTYDLLGNKIFIENIGITPKHQGEDLGYKTVQDIFDSYPGVTAVGGDASRTSIPFWERIGAKVREDGVFSLTKTDFFNSKASHTILPGEVVEVPSETLTAAGIGDEKQAEPEQTTENNPFGTPPPVQDIATGPITPLEQSNPQDGTDVVAGTDTGSEGQLSIPGLSKLGEVQPSAVKSAISEAIRPKAEFVTRREDVLLRQRIRAEARGAKAGFKEGAKVTREILQTKFREQTQTMQQIRTELAEFIKQELPQDARGKFLDSIKQDLTLRQQFKMLERVEREKNKIIRAEIIPKLKQMSELSSDSIALKYKKSLNELLSNLDFKKPSSTTKRNLNGLKEVLLADPDFAKLHPDLLARVERLTRQPVADMSTIELKALQETAEVMVERGKLMHDLETTQTERKFKIALRQFADSTVQVSGVSPLKDMSQSERMKYESKRSTFGTLHTMRVARILDGYKENGENMKAIKDLSATENYSNDQANLIKEDMLKRISDVVAMEDITEEMQIRITAQSLIDQGKITEANGLLKAHPVEGAADVTELELTDTEQQLLEVGRSIIKDHLEAKTIATYETLEGEIFPKVENYTPIFYEGEVNLLASDVVNQQKFSKRNVEKGFTMERQKDVKKIPRHDFFGMIADHIDSATWYINLQPKLTTLAKVTQSEEYLNAGGSLAVEYWRGLIDIIARRGFSANYQANYWLKKMRINLSQSMLGFRVTSVVSQPFAVFDAMAAAQAQYGPKASAEIMKEFMQSWLRPGYTGDIVKNSPALNQRQGGELAITESLRAIEEAKTWYQKAYGKFVKASFKLLQKGDVKTAAGVQQGIENILIKNGVKDAKQEAEFFMNMVSASSNVTLRPTVLATGDMARLWFTFQTFTMNRWGVIWEDIIKTGVVHGDWKKKMNSLTGIMILLAGMLAEELARRKVKELLSGSKQDNLPSMTEVAITAIPRNIPYFGALFDIFSPFDPSVSPAFLTSVTRIGKGVQSAITGKKPETQAKGLLSAVQNFIGLLFGIPGSGQASDLLNNVMFPKEASGDTIDSGTSDYGVSPDSGSEFSPLNPFAPKSEFIP